MHEASLIQPLGAEWDWQHEGLCRTRSPELFFHPDGERGSVKRAREARAIALCQACPVISECREHALTVPEPYGVWGGLTEEERAEILALQDRRIS
ncbi:WhiB family transcriptional regulator [Ornithinimicrobium cavernae]|uniref:WhiB family transcriptional regulator n=1 Tax=Ornithinimicrobium cavernae TaxID=2666047 RepID=UPI000D69AA22|nr:WhiB family transcriptional regulator [Ornithinimicrobium cavernae]